MSLRAARDKRCLTNSCRLIINLMMSFEIPRQTFKQIECNACGLQSEDAEWEGLASLSLTLKNYFHFLVPKRREPNFFCLPRLPDCQGRHFSVILESAELWNPLQLAMSETQFEVSHISTFDSVNFRVALAQQMKSPAREWLKDPLN